MTFKADTLCRKEGGGKLSLSVLLLLFPAEVKCQKKEEILIIVNLAHVDNINILYI